MRTITTPRVTSMEGMGRAVCVAGPLRKWGTCAESAWFGWVFNSGCPRHCKPFSPIEHQTLLSEIAATAHQHTGLRFLPGRAVYASRLCWRDGIGELGPILPHAL